jgi:hypothetical protein
MIGVASLVYGAWELASHSVWGQYLVSHGRSNQGYHYHQHSLQDKVQDLSGERVVQQYEVHNPKDFLLVFQTSISTS